MQKVFQKIRRYLLGLINFFIITEVAAVLVYFVLKAIGNVVSLSDLLLEAAIYYCIVVVGTSLIMILVKVGMIIYIKLKQLIRK